MGYPKPYSNYQGPYITRLALSEFRVPKSTAKQPRVREQTFGLSWVRLVAVSCYGFPEGLGFMVWGVAIGAVDAEHQAPGSQH